MVYAIVLLAALFLTGSWLMLWPMGRKEKKSGKAVLTRVHIDELEPTELGRRMMYAHWSDGQVDVYLQDEGPYWPKNSNVNWFGVDGKELDYNRAERYIQKLKETEMSDKITKILSEAEK